MASEPIEAIREEIESLKTLRDELRVKIHLGGAEAQAQLEGKMKRVAEVTHDSAEELSEAAGLLAEAIRKGYKQIRDVL